MASNQAQPAKKKKEEEDSLKTLRRNARKLFAIGLLIVFIAPFLLTLNGPEWLNFRGTGPIGDTIGGIVGPIINAISAIIIFLSFYQQVKANKILSDQVLDQKNVDYLSKLVKQLEKIIRKMYFQEQVVEYFSEAERIRSESEMITTSVEPVGLDKLREGFDKNYVSPPPTFNTTETTKGFELLLYVGSNLHRLFCTDSDKFYLVFNSNLKRELLHFLRIMKNLCIKIKDEDIDSSAELIQLVYWQESYLDAVYSQLENIKERKAYIEIEQTGNKIKTKKHEAPELMDELKTEIDKMTEFMKEIKTVLDDKSKKI